jgi:soluble lytic murein transglycosylase
VLLTALLFLAIAPAWAADAGRAEYREALRLLNAGRDQEYRALRSRLDAYVLAPYLDYHALARRVDRLGEAEMRAFRATNPDLPVTRLLYHRWLTRLGARGDWQTLARNPPEEPGAELECLYLRARLETGATDALDEVARLWTVGRSQPDACDALFEAWIAAGRLQEALVWERLTLAVQAGQSGLARYLLRFLQGAARESGEALYEAHVNPAAALEHGSLDPERPETSAIVTHGLERLGASQPERAAALWRRYRQTHTFSTAESTRIASAILLAHGREGRFAEPWPPAVGADAPPELAEKLAQLAVNRQQWAAARDWIARLTPEQQATTRWRYWSARALEGDPASAADRREHFRALGAERDYYGFLAAQRAAVPPRLNAAPDRFDPDVARAVGEMPAVRRALELYAVDDLLNARREWYRLLPTLDRAGQLHAAYLAQRSGWIPQSIQMANAAMLNDHVDLRFPVAYPELFAGVSERTAVAKPFLLAVARQESLFDPGARSSADARGLMQLLPTTAIDVARRHALAAPHTRELHQPALNVELGGRYLAQLLARYGERRPLAAAAYNAGQGRVDRWIAERAGEPVDVWIENIPFPETRNYVKNVMAFTQVYAQILGTPQPMLAPHETTLP